jgi:putative ABC transport system permease protein
MLIISNLKNALRSILRNKVQSFISIIGLSIGLGCIILLMALILHEKSFDRFIPDHRNLYRIVFGQSGLTQYPLAEKMKEEFPEVKDFFRFNQTNRIELRNQKNELVSDRNFGFSDPSIFKILGVRLISGDPASSVSDVAIAETTARKYFGNLSPQGSVLQVKLNDSIIAMTVSGVYRDFPTNSTLNPLFIADIKLAENLNLQFQKTLGDYGNEMSSLNWKYSEFLSYVLIDKNADSKSLAAKIGKYKELMDNEDIKDLEYSLQPVRDIYLKSANLGGSRFLRAGNANELKYYEAISFLILLISALNYVLLTRAATSERLHELGTRKVFGASERTLRRQIVLEANLVAIMSLIPAALVIDFGISFIDSTLNKTLSTDIFSNPVMWLLLISVVLITGTLSGFLIGYNYSRIPAGRLLSGKSSAGSGSKRWNYSFLMFHFTIFVILVSGVIAVSKQIKYSMAGYIGINPRNVLVTRLNTDELRKSFTAICDELKKIPGVQSTAGGSFIPPFGNYLPINLATPEGKKERFDGLIMGEGMIELLGIEVIDGSSFGLYKPGPPEVLFNESSAKMYNVKAGENFLAFKVRGIVRDFHAHSLHTLIQPMVILQQNPDKMGLIAIKTTGTNDEAIIKRLRELYNQISPDEIFETSYLTDDIENFYGQESNQSRIIAAFSALAAILAMMGLFGISLITISKRKKEIGIRKVNGASINEVLLMLNADFIKWVLVSIVIAVPASIYIYSKWLERFAYRTELRWWIYGLAGLSAVLIALLTVSWQSWRAATRNPVEALRYE